MSREIRAAILKAHETGKRQALDAMFASLGRALAHQLVPSLNGHSHTNGSSNGHLSAVTKAVDRPQPKPAPELESDPHAALLLAQIDHRIRCLETGEKVKPGDRLLQKLWDDPYALAHVLDRALQHEPASVRKAVAFAIITKAFDRTGRKKSSTPNPHQGSLFDEESHPREESAHDGKRPGEFAPKSEEKPPATLDNEYATRHNTSVPPTVGGESPRSGKMQNTVKRNGREFVAEHPEPLKNDAGAVEFNGVFSKINLQPTEQMRLKGITSISSVSRYVENHPTAGPVVSATTNKGKTLISLNNNPSVKALLDNAKEIDDAVQQAAHDTDPQVKKDAELRGQMHREAAAYIGKIPADHTRVHWVKTGSSDGDEVGRYEADGVEIPWSNTDLVHHGTAAAIRSGATGAFDSVSVHSIPTASLQKIKADRATKQQAETDKITAESKRVAELTAKARTTGKPQLVRTWTQSVDEEDNSMNVVNQYVHPDSTLHTVSIPTH